MVNFELGDLIEIERWGGLYSHWAVYIGKENGEDCVVHMTDVEYVDKITAGGAEPGASTNGVVSYKDAEKYREALEKDLAGQPQQQLVGGPLFFATKAQIKKATLQKAVEGSKHQKNNSLDKKHRPRSGKETVMKALEWVGTTVTYSTLYFNCEHFAHLCRNGRLVSCQADIWPFPASKEKLRKLVGDEVFEKIKRDLINDN